MNRTQAIRTGFRLLIATTSFFAVPTIAGELELTIHGIESDAGQLMIAVVNSEAAFNGEAPPVLSLLIAPRPGTLTFSTDALPDGDYGIRVMHDENGNGDMEGGGEGEGGEHGPPVSFASAAPDEPPPDQETPGTRGVQDRVEGGEVGGAHRVTSWRRAARSREQRAGR